jgi:hypothetical protein
MPARRAMRRSVILQKVGGMSHQNGDSKVVRN